MVTGIWANRAQRIKILVGALVVSFIAVTVLLLELFMTSLLERDAFVDGMRWAANVENSVDDLEKVFAGEDQYFVTSQALAQITALGHVYRIEFQDTTGRIAFAIGSFVAPQNVEVSKSYRGGARHAERDAQNGQASDNSMTSLQLARRAVQVARQNGQTDQDHGVHDVDTGHAHSALRVRGLGGHQAHEDGHAVSVLLGDGVVEPINFAKIIHPVVAEGTLLGEIVLYMDQTETQVLLRDTMLTLFVILIGMSVIAFLLPGIFYLRGRTAAKKAYEQVRFYAQHDALTQLFNRRFFTETVDRVLAETREHDVFHALHFIDLDSFKPVNDSFGHDVGDELLRKISRRLQREISDAHVISRIGGDEFAVFQCDARNAENIERFARHLQRIFSDGYDISDRVISVSASIGTAVSLRDGDNCKALMKCADLALYTVKASGRNGERVFEPSMMQAQDERMEMEAALRDALAQNKFELHFQPLFFAADAKLSGFEALLRMRCKDGHLVPPDAFIRVAEEIGLMEDIGSWVIDEAVRIACNWPENLSVAVNLSITQFESGKLSAIVADALARHGLSPQRLELEITEGLMLTNTDQNVAQLHELKELGPSIAMDDFGTGYSSLGYLWRFPFDKIKIDRSFLQGFDSDAGKMGEVIQTIISLGHSLDMVVTAEGVETQDQLRMLRGLGCDFLQGYLLGRPIPANQIVRFLINDLRAQLEAKDLPGADMEVIDNAWQFRKSG